MCFRRMIRLIAVFSLLLTSSTVSTSLFASDLNFSDQYQRIFQIRVISPDAGSKSSIGSGFQISAEGHIITNFHVVSAYIESPDTYNIQYASQDGTIGELELLDFDVVSDLALLKHPAPHSDFFELQSNMPKKGELAYALGNPGDWGIVMVPGPTNGFVEHSYSKQILFSGSLNAGMSGGPSLNSKGDIIGVNVASAGSQLSFLVPAMKAQKLLDREVKLLPQNYMSEVATQIKHWQQPRVQELIDAKWPIEEFMGRSLFGEIRHDFQCWGETNESDEERTIASVSKWCKAGDEIYINRNFDAGQIRFSFNQRLPIKLNKFQFAKMQTVNMSADNHSYYEQSTNYKCNSNFVQSEKYSTNSYHKITTCIRAYKKLNGLFDSLLMIFSSDGESTFKSHLSLSAMEKDQIVALQKRFIGAAL